jgi:hypothetical protein
MLSACCPKANCLHLEPWLTSFPLSFHSCKAQGRPDLLLHPGVDVSLRLPWIASNRRCEGQGWGGKVGREHPSVVGLGVPSDFLRMSAARQLEGCALSFGQLPRSLSLDSPCAGGCPHTTNDATILVHHVSQAIYPTISPSQPPILQSLLVL